VLVLGFFLNFNGGGGGGVVGGGGGGRCVWVARVVLGPARARVDLDAMTALCEV